MMEGDNRVLEVARCQGWTYDHTYDLFRKKMPNRDIISISRHVVMNTARSYGYWDIEEVFMLADAMYLRKFKDVQKATRMLRMMTGGV